MKKIFTWFWLFQKRIIKKPMFQMTILLIPTIVLLLFIFNEGGGSMVRVAVCSGSDELSDAFTDKLLDSSNSVIQFYECENEKELREDVIRGKAECGYIFADDLFIRLQEGDSDSANKSIAVINKDSSVTTKVINEIICGKMFSEKSYKILEEFIMEKHPEYFISEDEHSKLKKLFEEYKTPKMMFDFQYINGEENVLLDGEDHNYYMMPVRGILSVLMLVAAMSGILMLYKDEKKGTWEWIRLKNRPVFNYVFILMPVFLPALVSLIAIFATGLNTGIITEIILMCVYVILVAGFCNLIRTLVKNIYVVCSLLPILVLLSLVISPVFIDLGDIMPGIDFIRLFIPSGYYLEALYSQQMQLKMIVAAVVFSMAGVLIDFFGFIGRRTL